MAVCIKNVMTLQATVFGMHCKSVLIDLANNLLLNKRFRGLYAGTHQAQTGHQEYL